MVTWEIAALERQIATLKTKLAMRDQQLREADAVVARLRVDVDDLRLVAVRADMQRMALSERLGSTEPETAPELWEAIVTAAIWWRRGGDRGELAAAVDAFTGETPHAILTPGRGTCLRCGDRGTLTEAFGWIHDGNGGRRCPVPGIGALRGEVLESSFDPLLHTLSSAPVVKGPLHRDDEEAVAEFARMKRVPIRPEQYADGAGAQAWRQAMGGKL